MSGFAGIVRIEPSTESAEADVRPSPAWRALSLFADLTRGRKSTSRALPLLSHC